jgi:hypothetical protein
MLERLIWEQTSNMFSQTCIQNSSFNTKYTVKNKYKSVLNIQIYFLKWQTVVVTCLLNYRFTHQYCRCHCVAKVFTTSVSARQFLSRPQINYCCSTSHSCTVLQYVVLFKEIQQKYFLHSRQFQYLLSISIIEVMLHPLIYIYIYIYAYRYLYIHEKYYSFPVNEKEKYLFTKSYFHTFQDCDTYRNLWTFYRITYRQWIWPLIISCTCNPQKFAFSHGY